MTKTIFGIMNDQRNNNHSLLLRNELSYLEIRALILKSQA